MMAYITRHIVVFCVMLLCIFTIVNPAVLPSIDTKTPSDTIYLLSKMVKEFVQESNEIFPSQNAVSTTKEEIPILLHLFDAFNIGKYIKKYETSVSISTMCSSCKFGITMLKYYVALGGTENDVGNIAGYICKLFHIETSRVCDGVANMFKKEVFTVLSKASFSASDLCSIALGQCQSSTSHLQNWTVPLTPFPKPPVRPILPPKPGSPVLRVLHLSDTHIDPYYKEGSLADCGEPLCCRPYSGAIPKEGGAGYWGDYHNCDTPLRTFENMLDHINKTHKFDYVIWTGDIPPHDIWNNSRSEAIYLIQEASKLMKKYLGNVPIFPALGNHESSPVDSFPIPEITGNDSISWLYNELVNAWIPLFSYNTSETIKVGGFYSVPVYPGFRIISINMNYCNNLNWWLFLNSKDPTGELAWLVNELQMAEIKGEKVHIIGHIPPGNFDCLSVWSHNYYEIIKRYESTVTAQFFGHTHNDEYELFYDTDEYKPTSRPFSIAYIGPSVTTYNGLNPGYRIYDMDGNYNTSSWVVLDHYSYYMNLTEANETKNPQWRLSYTAKKAFNMTSLLPSEWDKLTKRFEDDDDLFQQFYRYFTKMSDFQNKPCDANAKKILLCRLRRGCSDKNFCWS